MDLSDLFVSDFGSQYAEDMTPHAALRALEQSPLGVVDHVLIGRARFATLALEPPVVCVLFPSPVSFPDPF